MVMTMGLLGREKKRNIVYLGIFHVLGATLGGALIGGFLGAVEWSLLLSKWHREFVVIVTAFALWQSITRRPARLGLQRQVPRIWAHTMVPERSGITACARAFICLVALLNTRCKRLDLLASM